MLLLIIRILYLFIATGAIAAYCFSESTSAPEIVQNYPRAVFLAMELVAVFVVLVDMFLPRKKVEVVSAIYFGLLVGALLSFLFNQALTPFFSTSPNRVPFKDLFAMLSFLAFPYLCITFLLQTGDQFRFVIPYVEFARELKGGRPLVLDSSALIDGRIADMVDTNMVDAQVVVPQFILQEVQDIADSHDKVRRSRGRRGLDILKRLQQDPKIEVRVHESDASKGKSVDQRLIEVSKNLNGRLVTNDLNLNKLAGVQGVDVINLNDVANSLKPRFIPGEHLRIKIIKEGEGFQQGIGYLDDGTMVVVEQGLKEIGNEVDTVVTSVLQNSAGRMLFAKIVDGTTKT